MRRKPPKRGRPPKPPGTVRVRVYLRLAPETVAALDAAVDLGLADNRTEAVEMAVDDVWKQESPDPPRR